MGNFERSISSVARFMSKTGITLDASDGIVDPVVVDVEATDNGKDFDGVGKDAAAEGKAFDITGKDFEQAGTPKALWRSSLKSTNTGTKRRVSINEKLNTNQNYTPGSLPCDVLDLPPLAGRVVALEQAMVALPSQIASNIAPALHHTSTEILTFVHKQVADLNIKVAKIMTAVHLARGPCLLPLPAAVAPILFDAGYGDVARALLRAGLRVGRLPRDELDQVTRLHGGRFLRQWGVPPSIYTLSSVMSGAFPPDDDVDRLIQSYNRIFDGFDLDECTSLFSVIQMKKYAFSRGGRSEPLRFH